MATTLFTKTALANGTSNLLVRSMALNQSTDLLQTGVVFNDAVRISTGLFSQAGSGNQNPFLGSYTTDIHAVQNDITAMLANPGHVTVNGATFALNTTDTAVLNTVNSQLTTLLTAAAQTTNVANLTAADQTLHTVQNEILQEINNDPHIAAALNNVTFMATTGAVHEVAFQNVPAGADDAASLAAATAGSSLHAVGTVFNAAADLAAGGISAGNLGQVTTDLQAVASGITNILNNATQLATIEANETANAKALTTVHLQTVLNQVNLQLNTYDAAEANGSQHAIRGTADNLLDIIDIVQNDTALNTAAGGNGAAGHIGGFAEMPGGLTGTVTKFQDNQAQTNFWAAFLSEANTINAQLTAIQNGTAKASAALVTQIQNYEHFGQMFDAAQGAIFQARFDNELLSGTLEADSSNAINGLNGILNGDTGAKLAADMAQINAAGQGFVADAKDVSGNNIAIGGATYVGTATTVSTATSVHGLAQGTIPVTATPNIANGTGGAAATSTTTTGAGGATTGAGAGSTGTSTAGTGTTSTGNNTGSSTTTGTTTSGNHTGSTTTTGTTTTGSHTGTTSTTGTTTTGACGNHCGNHTGTATSTGTTASLASQAATFLTDLTNFAQGHGSAATVTADLTALLQAAGLGNAAGAAPAAAAAAVAVPAAFDPGAQMDSMHHMFAQMAHHM